MYERLEELQTPSRGRIRTASGSPPPTPAVSLPRGAEQEAPSVTALAKIFTRWDEIADPAWEGHVWPLRINSEVLVVGVDQPARATQVRVLGAALLDQVRTVIGTAPATVEVVVRRPG